MMDLQGYCMIKSADNCFIGHDQRLDPDGYNEIVSALNEGTHIYPVMDIANSGTGLLVLNSYGPQCLIDVRSFDSVAGWFKCTEFNGVLLPPNITDFVTKMFESMKRLTREGGYDKLVKKMVIMASILKGEFNDDFLFSKYANENEE